MASTQVTGTRVGATSAASAAYGIRASARVVSSAIGGGFLDLARPQSSLAALSFCVLAALSLHAGLLSGLDVVLGASLLLHVGTPRTSAGAAGLWGIGQAGAVFCVIGSFEALSWPAALWLLAVPAAAWRAGDRSAALVALSAAGAAFGLLSSADYLVSGDTAGLVPGQLAAAYLIATSVFGVSVIGARRAATVSGMDVPAERAALLMELAGDVVACHGPEGDVLGVHGGGITGDRHALRGQGLFDRIHVPDRPAYLRALSDAAHAGTATRVLVRICPDDPGAGLRSAELRVSPAHPDHAHLWPADTAAVSVLRDVSDIRHEADAIEGDLRDATRTSAAKSRFLASVTHELRTPLNAIIGFAELLSGEHPFVVTEERRREYAGIIRDSGRHLVEVVNTLLDVAKIEGGQFAFAPEPVDLAALADGCCDLLQLQAERAGVTLSAAAVNDVRPPLADRRACRQILINLVANAIKFSRPGGAVAVTIRQEGDRVVLGVGDDGVGIREADLARVGDPFFQAGGQQVLSADGTGLGLSVVRGLVGLHRGTMTIESGPGLGTTVSIELPLRGEGEPGTAVDVRTVLRRSAPILDTAPPERAVPERMSA